MDQSDGWTNMANSRAKNKQKETIYRAKKHM